MAANIMLNFGYLAFSTSLFDYMFVFCIKVALFQLNLALISQIVKKLQPFSEIQDYGIRHFKFCNYAFSAKSIVF